MRAFCAQIVDFSRFALCDGQVIPSHNVAHVAKVTAGFQVADVHRRITQPHFCLCNLLGEIGGDKGRALARANVIEGTHAHNGKLVAGIVLVAQHILCHFAHRVWAIRSQRVGLAHGQLVRGHNAVLIG